MRNVLLALSLVGVLGFAVPNYADGADKAAVCSIFAKHGGPDAADMVTSKCKKGDVIWVVTPAPVNLTYAAALCDFNAQIIMDNPRIVICRYVGYKRARR